MRSNQKAGVPTAALWAGSMPTPKPVSYTHLRAHETVLDLVCRLLLENKKTTISDYASLLESEYLTHYILLQSLTVSR